MRKKKFILLRGKKGSFIVVLRSWYESKGIGKQRGSNQMWVIAAQHDDENVLKCMAELSGRYVSGG
jgi:hypothetical protein